MCDSAEDVVKTEAFVHSLIQSVVGIVGKDESGKFGRQVGTGTLVKVNNCRGILTAEHVVQLCEPAELRFWMPHSGVQLDFRDPKVARNEDRVERAPLDIAKICRSADLDIAFLELSERAIIEDFWTFRELTPSPARADLNCALIGFPSALAYQGDDRGNLVSKPRLEILKIVDPAIVASTKFFEALHFATTYPSLDRFSPGGFSGGAVWVAQEQGEQVWRSNPAFLGVVTHHMPGQNFLKAVRVDAIQNFLDGCVSIAKSEERPLSAENENQDR